MGRPWRGGLSLLLGLLVSCGRPESKNVVRFSLSSSSFIIHLTSGVFAQALEKHNHNTRAAIFGLRIKEATGIEAKVQVTSLLMTIMISIPYILYTVLSGLSSLAVFRWSVLVLCANFMCK